MPVSPILLAALLATPPQLAAPAQLVTTPASPHPDPTSEALRALAYLRGEGPAIAEVRLAAAREAEREPAPLATFARRARLAALLPRITAEGRYDERSYRVVGLQGSGEVDYLRLAPGRALAMRATWDLGATVAAREELAAASAVATRARRREEAVRRATELYYERRRALVHLLLSPPPTALARADAELAIDRLTAELDGLTGGLLSRGGRR
jgi:hypothetical protein